MAQNIIRIKSNKELLAVMIKSRFNKNGIQFFVPDGYAQQLGYMKRPKGYVISAHIHTSIQRKISMVQEVLFIRNGKVRIDFYDKKKHYVESRVAGQGDVVFLASGGHGFEFLQDSQIIEVKQGPFIKGAGPVRFDSVKKGVIRLKK